MGVSKSKSKDFELVLIGIWNRGKDADCRNAQSLEMSPDVLRSDDVCRIAAMPTFFLM